MCGIVGALSRERTPAINARLMRTMLGTIRHRGPDQFGVYLYEDEQSSIGMGNARLSIIDLGGGQQPVSNEDGTLWIVFNGEIFNHVELRRDLLASGHRLATESDTEVIVHLYEEHGPDCLQLLNGQFAMAIWDERSRKLFLARDRTGIRPLYYAKRPNALVFASEMKALLAHPEVSAEIDPCGLNEIFTFWSTLAPQTVFRGIHALPPGHWMLATPNGESQCHRYWDISFPRRGEERFTDKEAARVELRRRLIDAVQLRLRADVPVGAYLSGGLDSSAITALIRDVTDNQLETFSIAFADEAFDESEFQRQMARHLGTRHHIVTCTHADIGRVFPDVVWHAETPITRTAPAPLYLLSSLVRKEGLKVVLTGEGADEFLSGYNIFREAKVRRFWARQPESQWRHALLGSLYPYVSGLSGGNREYLRKFFGQGLGDTADDCYSHHIRWRNTARITRLFSASVRASIGESHRDNEGTYLTGRRTLPADFASWGDLAKAQYLEATIFLPEYLLSSQGDRMLMAHSVEGRFPFLDHEVIEFCSQLSPHLKLCGLNEKYLLKEAVRDLLPETIWKRPKRPYRAPVHASFFPGGQPLEWVADVVSPRAIRDTGYFDPDGVAKLVNKLQRFRGAGETDGMALAAVLSTQLVHQRFVADYQSPDPLCENDDVKTVVRHGRSDLAKPPSRR